MSIAFLKYLQGQGKLLLCKSKRPDLLTHANLVSPITPKQRKWF